MIEVKDKVVMIPKFFERVNAKTYDICPTARGTPTKSMLYKYTIESLD
jgi:hypothetical protein